MKKKILWALVSLLSISPVPYQAAPVQELNKPFVVNTDIYDFNIIMDSFIIKPQNTKTEFQIDLSYLPESKNLKNLPVVYVTDGQWRRMDHKYIHYLTYKKIIPPVIVAGIGYPEKYNADQVRVFDLLLNPDNFLKAIKQEIIPVVEKKISGNPKKRIIFGASLGGHFVTHAFLKNSLDQDTTFWGYLGSSTYLLGPGAKVFEAARKLASKKRVIKSQLYLAYGEREGQEDYHVPNDTLFKILESKNLQDFHFFHHVYPDSDHFTNTRLTLIDGLRLFLAEEHDQGIGAIDLNYKSFQYDFKTTTQYYDWQTNVFAQNSYSTDLKYSSDQYPGSFKVAADFNNYDSLNFNTSSVFFENFADRELEVSIYVPEELAQIGYTLQFLIYSTFTTEWIMDTSEKFSLNKNGWNSFQYKWRNKVINGNADCIRGFGVMITRPETAPVWKGELYFDGIKW